jgi:hypothetical protein
MNPGPISAKGKHPWARCLVGNIQISYPESSFIWNFAMLLKIFRNALLATLIPNLAWAYFSWQHPPGMSPLYVWPCTLITAIWYGYRAHKYHLHSSCMDLIVYEFQSIRVGWAPFLGLIFLGLLGFAIDPHANSQGPGVVLLIGMLCWLAYSAIAFFVFPESE